MGLIVIRTTAAGDGLYALDLVADLGVEGGVSEVHNALVARVRVRVLSGFGGAEYARLFGVHSSVPTFLWAGLRGVQPPAGPFPYPMS